MDFLRADQPKEITSILCNQNKVLFEAPSQNRMVRRTQPTEVSWMQYDVGTIGIQASSNPWRQALIEEQPH